MITGLGIDIIEIERIRKAIDKNPRFLTKVFTIGENAYFESKNMAVQSIAGTFAAKEAVSKVLGSGISGFKWTDIEIVRDTYGKPSVTLYGGAKERAHCLSINRIEISIAHHQTSAVANAIGFEDLNRKGTWEG